MPLIFRACQKICLFCFWLVVFCPPLAVAKEAPQVIHFTKQQYQGQHQNWSIYQAPDKRMFFGNSSGLLMFDGAHWQNFSTRGEQVIRAVFCDESGRAFIGGYAKAGYWAPDDRGQLSYHSILDGIEFGDTQKEEVWHFLSTKIGLFFQSFSTLYKYHEGRVEVISPPGNIMFIREIEDRILVPVIHQGLYEYLPDGSFDFLPNTEKLAEKRVAAILPQEGGAFLIATQEDGFYQYAGNTLKRWQVEVNEELRSVQVNKGIRMANGNYAIGTILDGIYILSPEGALLFHINQENGLQNNTVLALYEDEASNIWAALDKGIDLILTSSSLLHFTDIKGQLGSVFTAAIFKGRLFIGTNQGVFYKEWPSQQNGPFHLVRGSQGQAWELKEIEGRLFCAHNAGLLEVNKDFAKPVYSQTGVYRILEPPLHRDCLLLATYTGLAVLRKNGRSSWLYSHSIDEFSLSAKVAFFDRQGRLWVAHPYKGVYCLQFDEELAKAVQLPLPEIPGFPPFKELSASLTYHNGFVYAWPDSGSLVLDAREEQVQVLPPEKAVLVGGEGKKWLPGIGTDQFFIHPHHIEYRNHQGLNAFLEIGLIPNNEQIINLNDSIYLAGTENGYGLFNKKQAKDISELNLPIPLLSKVEVNGGVMEINSTSLLEQVLTLQPSENNLRFWFALPFFSRKLNLRYRLLGFETSWSSFDRVYVKEYTNLPPGLYEFQVQSALSPTTSSFHFSIEPPWHQSWWANLLFLASFLGLVLFLLKLHNTRMALQRRRLELQKERELQRQKIYSRNEILRTELLSKSRKLADSTMELIRKNEILIKLKKELNLLRRKREPEKTAHQLYKMITQIDRHLRDEEDWKVFESNFNQVHDQFFKRLKNKYPELTPGDLRLAAYLKMNLSSKEIAPLLNISLRGVENKRYRLRRKMHLLPEENLTELLMQF